MEELAEGEETTASLAARGILGLTQNKVYEMVIERAVDEQSLMQKQEVLPVEPKLNETVTNGMIIYPNPADDGVKINYTCITDSENIKIKLIDVIGKTIFEINNLPSKGIETFNTNSLNNGIYFILLTNNNTVVEVKRVVINH